MGKSIGVVTGSYALSVILVLATGPLLAVLFPGEFDPGRVPSDSALVSSTALFFVISTLCAWVCARFAPGRPSYHVLWLFLVGEVMGFAFTAANWNNGWPRWYSFAWLLAWPLSCYIGLLLANRKHPVVVSH